MNVAQPFLASAKMHRFELLAVFTVVAGLRIAGILFVFPQLTLEPDVAEFRHLAKNLAETGTFGFASNWRDDTILRQNARCCSFLYDQFGSARTPGFPLLLAGLRPLFGESQLALDIVLALLEGISAVLLYMVARLAIGLPAARMAVLIYCFNPGSIMSVSYGGRESLLTALVLAGTYLLMKASDGSWRFVVAAGIFLGLSGYVKETITLIAFFGAAWLVILGWRQRRSLFWQAMAVGLCAVATWTPWIVRNSAAYHHLTGMGTASGLAFWHGIVDQEWPYDCSGHSDHTQGLSPSEKIRLNPWLAADARDADSRFKELVKIAIFQEPMILPKGILRNVGCFWNPVSHHVMQYGLQARPQEVVTGGCYILFFALGVLGLWRFRESRWTWLVVFILLGETLVHSLTFSVARYRVPFDPLLMVFVAGEICRRIDRYKQANHAIASSSVATP